MADTDSMTLDELQAYLATVDDLDDLAEMHVQEQDGQNRKGAHELIDSRIAQMTPKDAGDWPTYDMGVEEKTTFVVGHPDGEVEFTTDDDGRFTPANEKEEWAVHVLGAKEE